MIQTSRTDAGPSFSGYLFPIYGWLPSHLISELSWAYSISPSRLWLFPNTWLWNREVLEKGVMSPVDLGLFSFLCKPILGTLGVCSNRCRAFESEILVQQLVQLSHCHFRSMQMLTSRAVLGVGVYHISFWRDLLILWCLVASPYGSIAYHCWLYYKSSLAVRSSWLSK